jgi:hypothetical protein
MNELPKVSNADISSLSAASSGYTKNRRRQMVIKWQDTTMTAPNWFDFSLDDIMHMPVSHAVNLFSSGVPVVIKEGERYIVNTPALLDSYKKQGKRVMLIDQVDTARMDQKLSVAGFIS